MIYRQVRHYLVQTEKGFLKLKDFCTLKHLNYNTVLSRLQRCDSKPFEKVMYLADNHPVFQRIKSRKDHAKNEIKFIRALEKAVRKAGSRRKLSETLLIPISTINRWYVGKHFPLPKYRKALLNFLLEEEKNGNG